MDLLIAIVIPHLAESKGQGISETKGGLTTASSRLANLAFFQPFLASQVGV
jgi:hypothetical protein